MQGKTQHSDDFGTFLQSVQHAVNASDVSNTSTMRIMTVLSRMGEVEVAQLITVVEMTWSDFSSGIESLRSAGLVMVEETNQGGKVRLTSDGKSWASALNSRSDGRAA